MKLSIKLRSVMHIDKLLFLAIIPFLASCSSIQYKSVISQNNYDGYTIKLSLPDTVVASPDDTAGFLWKSKDNQIEVYIVLKFQTSKKYQNVYIRNFSDFFITQAKTQGFHFSNEIDFSSNGWAGKEYIAISETSGLHTPYIMAKNNNFFLVMMVAAPDKTDCDEIANKIFPSLEIISPRVEMGENKKIVFFLRNNWWTYTIPEGADFSMLTESGFRVIPENGKSECNIMLRKYESAAIARERYSIVVKEFSAVSKRLLDNEILGNWNTSLFCNDDENKGYKEIIGLAYYKNFIITVNIESDNPISPDDLKQYKTMIENFKLGHKQ